MIQFIIWLITILLPLSLFLSGIKGEEQSHLTYATIMYSLLIFIGLLDYSKIIINESIKREIEKGVLKYMPVPEWLNFLALTISSFTLIYFNYELLGIFLLISSYGSYRLYGKILPYIYKNKMEGRYD